MNWDKYFSPEDLRDGFYYYQSGKVKGLNCHNEYYEARVLSSPISRVNIRIGKNQFSPSCSCWESKRKRGLCAHVAAVLYGIEEWEQEKNTSRDAQPAQTMRRIKPFGEYQKGDNYYFMNMKKITSQLNVFNSGFDQALHLIEQKKVRLTSFLLHDPTFRMDEKGVNKLADVSFEVTDTSTDIPIGMVSIRSTRNELISCQCNAPRCFYRYDSYGSVFQKGNASSPCIHTLAAFKLMDDYIRDYNPGDATDSKAGALMKMFRRNQFAGTISEKTKEIRLEPEIVNEDGDLSIGFRVGVSKMYKIRNLTEFVKAVQDQDTWELGKSDSINFAMSDFVDKSLPLYEFIQRSVQDNLYRNDRIKSKQRWGYYSSAEEKISGSIPLEGSALDEVFHMLREDLKIPYVHKDYINGNQKSTLHFAEGIPEIKLTITELSDEQQFAGIRVDGAVPDIFEGANDTYFVTSNTLCRIPAEELKNLQPIFDMADDEQNLSFHVGRKTLSEFYHSVLPELTKIAKITEENPERIHAQIPPKAEVLLLLDNEDGTVSCKPTITYGEKTHNPMDALVLPSYPELYRDYYQERSIMKVVSDYFPTVNGEEGLMTCDDEAGIYRIYREGLDQLLTMGAVQCTDAFQNRRIRPISQLKVGVSLESDLLKLEIHSGDISKNELIDILASYRQKKKYHKLRSGEFIDLEDESLHDLSQLLDSCRVTDMDLLKENLNLPLYRAMYVDKLLEKNEEMYMHRDKNFRRLIKDFSTIKDSDFEVPAGLEGVLRNYQVYGYKWLRTLAGCGLGGILADDMGLGKTIQAIAVIASALEDKKEDANPSLIVCPASLVFNWKSELNRFAPNLRVSTIAEGAKERKAQLENYREYDILVTSYDLLKRDVGDYENLQFDYMFIDEAQFIKNPSTAAAKAVKVIQARIRFALTGTPIENRLSELWSIFDYLMPGLLYDYETFRDKFETPITKNKDEEASQRLKKMVSPFILRRLKTDVLKDLPEKIEEIRFAHMKGEQESLYNAQVLKITGRLGSQTDAEFRKNKIQILAELTKIRQLCCDPRLLLEDYESESAKHSACLDLIESAIEGEHRILVFSQFTSMLELLAQSLKERNIPFYRITGSTPKEERLRLVNQFNEDTTPVFLISLKAGGTGLNLTGADIVIHYDPWWNLAAQNQATDRAHRIGQTRKVTVYKLICKDSIEEKIIDLQNKKKDLADEILNGETGNIGSLSREDLLELLT